MKTFTTIGLAAFSIAVAAAYPARAGPFITIQPENGTPFTVTDPGGCGPNGCIPLGSKGYISGGVGDGQTAPDLVLTPGTYRFTYVGHGDAVDHDTFTVGANTIHWYDPIGANFVYTVTAAGDLPFAYANLTTGYSISDSAFSPIQNLAYGLFFGPKPGIAYIGLTDLPYPGDHDFQDLGIRISIPESPTWAMMLVGFAGLGYAAFHRARARPVIA